MNTQNKSNTYQIICDELFRAGISPHLIGFEPLAAAVQLSPRGSLRKRKLTGEVYPQVAKLFGVTASAVERNIRTAISRAWTSGALTSYFGGKGVSLKRRPSNAEFIALMAYVVAERTAK